MKKLFIITALILSTGCQSEINWEKFREVLGNSLRGAAQGYNQQQLRDQQQFEELRRINSRAMESMERQQILYELQQINSKLR
jgi:hypothetical protein